MAPDVAKVTGGAASLHCHGYVSILSTIDFLRVAISSGGARAPPILVF